MAVAVDFASLATFAEEVPWHECPPVALRPGDVVLRRGDGVWTEIFIRKASREKRFSHIGIVTAVSNGVTIVHSEASDFTGIGSVHASTWEEFYDGALESAVFRFRRGETSARAIAAQAERYRGVPFDLLFDTDSTNRLYCTEFVRQAVNVGLGTNLVGTTMCDGRRIVTFDDVCGAEFDRIYDSLGPKPE